MGDSTSNPKSTRPRTDSSPPPRPKSDPQPTGTRPRSDSSPPPRPNTPPPQTGGLPPEQKDWIAGLAKDAEKNAKADERRAKQLELIGGVARDLANQADEIKAGQSYEIIEKNAGLFGGLLDAVGYHKTAVALDPGADPNNEFDTGSVAMDNYEGLTPDVLKKVMEAQRKVVELADRLRTATTDGGTLTKTPDGKPREEGDEPELMFTPDEIDGVVAAEIWHPLVRQRAIPENAVPDRYSEVTQTFKGASAAYQERLIEYTKTAPKRDGALRDEALIKAVADGTNAVASNVLAIVKDHLPGADAAATMAEIISIQTLIADLETVAFGITEAALKEEFDPQILVDCVSAIGQGLKLDKPTSEDNKAQIAAIKFGCSAALQSGAFVGYLAKGQPDKAMNVFGQFLNTAISAQETPTSGTTFADIGSDVQTSVSTLVSAAKASWLAKDGKYAEALEQLCDAIAEETKNYVDQKVEHDITAQDTKNRAGKDETFEEKEKLDTERDERIEQAELPFDTMIESVTSSPGLILALVTTDKKLAKQLEDADTSGKMDEIKKNWDKLTDQQKSAIVRMQRGAADLEAKASEEQMAETKKQFSELTASEEPAEIDKMIAEIKLQEARYTLAVKLAALPFQAIGALFPPAKMGASLINLANEMRLAAECGMQFVEWAENVDDAKRGGSVQAEAMTSRMDLSLVQTVRHGSEAALLVVQIIGQGITLAGGPVAHIGLALDKGASAAMAAKAVTTAVVDYRKAAKAWRIYQKALDQPQSRLTARKALRNNPTLAKYAIAYGAKQGNPFAVNALRKCGITDAILADENAGVAKLTEFLEAKFSEDPIVLRRVPTADWYPGTCAMTAASWMEFVAAGEEKASPKVEPKLKSANVAAALNMLEKAQAAYDAAGDDLNEKLVEALLNRLLAARRQLIAVKPTDSKGKPHEQFVTYLQALVGAAEARIDAASKMKDIVADAKKMFDHVSESFKPLSDEVMAMQPAPGTPLAGRKLAFGKALSDLDQLVAAQDWAGALAAVKAAKAEANEILDANTDLQAAFTDQLKVDLPKLEQAKAVAETDETRALLASLADLRLRMGEASKALDWELALDLLDEAGKTAIEIIGTVNP